MSVSLWSGREARSKYENLVSLLYCLGQGIHGTALGASHGLFLSDSSCIHAGATQQNTPLVRDPPDHPLRIVETVGRLLPKLSTCYGISHQKHGDLTVAREQRLSQAKSVVEPFGTVGWVVDDDERANDLTPFMAILVNDRMLAGAVTFCQVIHFSTH